MKLVVTQEIKMSLFEVLARQVGETKSRGVDACVFTRWFAIGALRSPESNAVLQNLLG